MPLALGSDSPVTPLDPWGTVRAAAFHRTPAHRISARAAFTAHTRGGWRAVGRDDAGVLVPGAPADYAVWRVGDLVVQAPDERVANWSTDPRSGTPGLPDLTPGGAAADRAAYGRRRSYGLRAAERVTGGAPDAAERCALGRPCRMPRGRSRTDLLIW